jgi:2'-5' RNA ligase
MPQLLMMVPVPEVEPHVAQLRARFDPSAKRGLGAHVTVLHSNLPAGALEPNFLAQIAAGVSSMVPFGYRITRVARFPGTLYLAAEPAGPFVLLREQVMLALSPGEREQKAKERFIPHVSVMRKSTGDDRDVESELTATLWRHGPISCVCKELTLLENSSGVWLQVQQFTLSGNMTSPLPGPL